LNVLNWNSFSKAISPPCLSPTSFTLAPVSPVSQSCISLHLLALQPSPSSSSQRRGLVFAKRYEEENSQVLSSHEKKVILIEKRNHRLHANLCWETSITAKLNEQLS
jgi:hypothetical protein